MKNKNIAHLKRKRERREKNIITKKGGREKNKFTLTKGAKFKFSVLIPYF